MTLSKFYELLRAHADITLEKAGRIIYHGPVKETPDEFDGLNVLDFKGTETGFIFYLK